MAARRQLPVGGPPGRPRAQFVFCIDEREESIRRAVEEQHPGYVTYGAAGFFGVAIDYQGLYDRASRGALPGGGDAGARGVRAADGVGSELARAAQPRPRRLAGVRTAQRLAVAAAHRRAPGCRSCSARSTAARTVARVMAPRSAMRVSERVKARFAPRPATRLSTLRAESAPPPPGGGKPVGLLARRVDRSRHRHAHQHRPGGRLRAGGRDPGPRLHQPEQPARVGARLRRLRRPPRRRQCPALRRHGQPPRVPGRRPPARHRHSRRHLVHRRAARHRRRQRPLLRPRRRAAGVRRRRSPRPSRRWNWPAPRTRSSAAAVSTTRRCTSRPTAALAHVEDAVGQPGAGAARVRPLHQRHLHRRAARR